MKWPLLHKVVEVGGITIKREGTSTPGEEILNLLDKEPLSRMGMLQSQLRKTQSVPVIYAVRTTTKT